MRNLWGWQRGLIPVGVTEGLRWAAPGLPRRALAPEDRALGVTPAHHILTFPESTLLGCRRGRGVAEKMCRLSSWPMG